MLVSGIVAEYNPFHNGHLYQLSETKRITSCDYIIATMSGHFTQRGMPCILDKYTRTKMALASGVDMVLELPVPYACASAQYFCEGAVSLLNKSNIVDYICFGSESGNIDLLFDIAKLLAYETPQMSHLLKHYLSQGISYPSARQQVVTEVLFEKSDEKYTKKDINHAMSHPNNILGIHYLRALLKYESKIIPVTVKRTSIYHDENIKSQVASATAIRKNLLLGHRDQIKDTMPSSAYAILLNTLKDFPLTSVDNLSMYLRYKLISSTLNHLYSLWDIPKDLCHSIYNSFDNFSLLSDLAASVTSKTYTSATVYRSLLRIILDIAVSDMQKLQCIQWIPYIRVLGVRKRALPLLSKLTEVSSVPVITNLGRTLNKLDTLSRSLIAYEQKATAIYYSSNNINNKGKEDLLHPFIVI